MAHVRAQSLRVHARGDHERGERVPTLVEADRLEAGAEPGGIRALADIRGRERLRVARPEDEADVAAQAELVLDQVVAERGWDRDGAPTGPALRSDDAFLGVPRALDVDDAGRQVDVLPAEPKELAPAEACIHRGRPDRPVALR